MIIWLICAGLTAIFVQWHQDNKNDYLVFTTIMCIWIWPFILLYEINELYFKDKN